MQCPGTGQCSVDAGGENPTGIKRYTLLTTGPLGGGTVAALPASQREKAKVAGGLAQKNLCEYPSCTVWPSNHASVNPISMQLRPPSLHGSEVASGAGASARAEPREKASSDASATKNDPATPTEPPREGLVNITSFGFQSGATLRDNS